MEPLPVGQGSKEPARGGVLGVSSATSFFLEFPLQLATSSGSRGGHAGCINVVVSLNISAPASPMVVWLRMAPKYPGLGVQKQVVGRPI